MSSPHLSWILPLRQASGLGGPINRLAKCPKSEGVRINRSLWSLMGMVPESDPHFQSLANYQARVDRWYASLFGNVATRWGSILMQWNRVTVVEPFQSWCAIDQSGCAFESVFLYEDSVSVIVRNRKKEQLTLYHGTDHSALTHSCKSERMVLGG